MHLEVTQLRLEYVDFAILFSGFVSEAAFQLFLEGDKPPVAAFFFLCDPKVDLLFLDLIEVLQLSHLLVAAFLDLLDFFLQQFIFFLDFGIEPKLGFCNSLVCFLV